MVNNEEAWKMFVWMPADIKTIVRKYFLYNKIKNTIIDSYKSMNGNISSKFNEKENSYANMTIFEYNEKTNLFVYKIYEYPGGGTISPYNFIRSVLLISEIEKSDIDLSFRKIIQTFNEYDFALVFTLYLDYFGSQGLKYLLLKLHKNFNVNADFIQIQSKNIIYNINPSMYDLIMFLKKHKIYHFNDFKCTNNLIIFN